MPKYIIQFEVAEEATFAGQEGVNALHEALCKAIHEKDTDAIDWLFANIPDVIHPDNIEAPVSPLMAIKDTYQIAISEVQRKVIVEGLEARRADDLDLSDLDDVQKEELSYLLPMFKELPEQEAENPGTLHGFCL